MAHDLLSFADEVEIIVGVGVSLVRPPLVKLAGPEIDRIRGPNDAVGMVPRKWILARAYKPTTTAAVADASGCRRRKSMQR
jgi:hypothetical protein